MKIRMHEIKKPLVVTLMLVLAGCSANGASPKGVTTANVSANVLQFAVGTANLYGTIHGLNVVATYRQPAGGGFKVGDSGTLLNSPQLTVPGQLPATPGTGSGYDATSTVLTGPATAELNGHVMNATSQVPNSTNLTTFGQSGGVFGIGIEPYNAYGSYDAPTGTSIGAPFQVSPYPVPLYDPSGDQNSFPAWGGPPSFDIAGNGQSVQGSSNYPTGTAGSVLGLDVFATVPAAAGPYQLTVVVPANTGRVTQTATAAIGNTTPLNAFSPPLVGGYGGGGITITAALPAGVTEAYLQVTDYGTPPNSSGPQPGSCNGSGNGNAGVGNPPPISYTIHVIHSGSYALGTAHGPGGSPSICTSADNTTVNGAPTPGDVFHVQGIGFDYPAFEMTYPKSLGNPAPAISGSAGQDDITLSLAANCNELVGKPLICSTELTPIVPGSKGRHGKPSTHKASSTTRHSVINL
jgi:hypothetical protein